MDVVTILLVCSIAVNLFLVYKLDKALNVIGGLLGKSYAPPVFSGHIYNKELKKTIDAERKLAEAADMYTATVLSGVASDEVIKQFGEVEDIRQ